MTIVKYMGYPRDFSQSRLARTVNKVAYRNNAKLAAWLGIDFVRGVDRPPSQSEQSLDTDETTTSPYIEAMSGNHPMMRKVAGPRPGFEGFIFPWAEVMWASPTAQKWVNQLHPAVKGGPCMRLTELGEHSHGLAMCFPCKKPK